MFVVFIVLLVSVDVGVRECGEAWMVEVEVELADGGVGVEEVVAELMNVSVVSVGGVEVAARGCIFLVSLSAMGLVRVASGLPVSIASHLCRSSVARRSKSSSSIFFSVAVNDAILIDPSIKVCLLSGTVDSGMSVCRRRSADTASKPLPRAV